LAGFPRDGSTVEALFQRADEALLEAKRSGKNRIYLVGGASSDIADIE
jgi:PleD family two-component response regulator